MVTETHIYLLISVMVTETHIFLKYMYTCTIISPEKKQKPKTKTQFLKEQLFVRPIIISGLIKINNAYHELYHELILEFRMHVPYTSIVRNLHTQKVESLRHFRQSCKS